MIVFTPFYGTVTMISDIINNNQTGCSKFMTVDGGNGNIVNFVVSPSTYFVDQKIVYVGDQVTAFYDSNAPAILIYPPQYPALVVFKENSYQTIKVDYFDSNLVSSDGFLKLNIDRFTPILLTNGQPFTGDPSNHYLIVIYSITTRSIPAQTTPEKIIVLCEYQS